MKNVERIKSHPRDYRLLCVRIGESDVIHVIVTRTYNNIDGDRHRF